MTTRGGKSGRLRRVQPWVVRFNILRDFLRNSFPDEPEYPGSLWASWERRVRTAHAAEEEQISRLFRARKEESGEELLDEDDDWAAEQYMEISRLTDYMCAALVVAMWSRMEHLLKDFVRGYRSALRTKQKALEKAREYCEAALSGKQHGVSIEDCLRALKEAKACIPDKFADIQESFEKETSILLSECRQFAVVDAIRVLNNAFKHSNGHYYPEDAKRYGGVDEALLRKWTILKEERIEYSKAPVKELVLACSDFCHDLLDKIERVLEKRMGREMHSREG